MRKCMNGSALLGASLLALLAACFPEPVPASPGFVGVFAGYLSPQEGPPLGLRVETALVAMTEAEYTFSGEALLEGVRYAVEGTETSNGGVRYQALPPSGRLSATFSDAAGTVRYTLTLSSYYGSAASWEREFEGELWRGEERFGNVRLRAEGQP
jgi:hypothetical protein